MKDFVSSDFEFIAYDINCERRMAIYCSLRRISFWRAKKCSRILIFRRDTSDRQIVNTGL